MCTCQVQPCSRVVHTQTPRTRTHTRQVDAPSLPAHLSSWLSCSLILAAFLISLVATMRSCMARASWISWFSRLFSVSPSDCRTFMFSKCCFSSWSCNLQHSNRAVPSTTTITSLSTSTTTTTTSLSTSTTTTHHLGGRILSKMAVWTHVTRVISESECNSVGHGFGARLSVLFPMSPFS